MRISIDMLVASMAGRNKFFLTGANSSSRVWKFGDPNISETQHRG